MIVLLYYSGTTHGPRSCSESSQVTAIQSTDRVTGITQSLQKSRFHGVVFWGSPIQERITTQGATIQSLDIGISLSIPEETLIASEQDVNLLIHPCFSGPFELPPGYKSASPAYLIEPSRKVQIQRDVTLQMHHYARLQNKEDCDEMAFLSASPTPQYQNSKPVYVFSLFKPSKGTFRPNSQVGEIAIQHFCFVMIGRCTSPTLNTRKGIAISVILHDCAYNHDCHYTIIISQAILVLIIPFGFIVVTYLRIYLTCQQYFVCVCITQCISRYNNNRSEMLIL